jgi:predicted AlkP superfamily phosphohydrolase/phosphomutase
MGQVEKKGALCRHLLARDRFDLVAIVFGESHVAGHQFWKYHADSQEGAEIEEDELTYAIRNVYRAIDREIGNLLTQLPSECNVFIVSSVGMEDQYPSTGLIEAFCRQLNYQTQQKNGSWKPLDLVRQVIPESLRIALSKHFSRDKRERLLADHFRNGTNWRKTSAFAIPAAYTSFVRVNLRGREPEGAVNPGEEYKELLNRLEADLRQLIDPETNQPAVTRVLKTVDLFDCDPHPSLPDLFVEWKPGRFMSRVRHRKIELMQKRPEFYRRSDHSSNGFVAAAGPSIQGRGGLEDTSLLGLAPTFLTLLGESVPPRLTGRGIESVLLG